MTAPDAQSLALGGALREWAGRFGLESDRELDALASELRNEAQSAEHPPLSDRETELITPHAHTVPRERRLTMARAALDTKAQLDVIALSPQKASEHVKVSASRLRQLADAGRIWAYRERTQWRIPLAQFHGGDLLPAWDTLWPQIPGTATPVSIYRFLTIPRDELGGWSVRDWLADGEAADPVVDIARGWHGP